MSRLVVLGSSGLLGDGILTAARARSRESLALSRGSLVPAHRFDLARPRDFDYACIDGGDTVVFTAAISSPDQCAADPGPKTRRGHEKRLRRPSGRSGLADHRHVMPWTRPRSRPPWPGSG